MKKNNVFFLIVSFLINIGFSIASDGVLDDSCLVLNKKWNRISSSSDHIDNVNELKYTKEKDLYYLEFSGPIYDPTKTSFEEKWLTPHERQINLGPKVFDYPWNCSFYLEIFYLNIKRTSVNRVYYGSATRISPNVLITAAHNLYDTNDGGYPDKISCFGACFNSTVLSEETIFPKMNPHTVFVPSGYVNNKNRSEDIALIILGENSLKMPGLIANPCTPPREYFKGRNFKITGYPGKRIAYTHEGKALDDPEQNRIKYDIDTLPGQSGSGIISIAKKETGEEIVYCCGVHAHSPVSEDLKYNIGVLLTDEICGMIVKMSIDVD